MKDMCADAGVLLDFLPPYSPDFNLIEEAFTELKAWMKKNIQLQDIFKFKTLKSEKWRYTIASKVEGCPWYLHAASVEDTSIFCIQSFINKHSCHGISIDGDMSSGVLFQR